MAGFNRVILMGNLTRDPEVTYTQSGQALCKFGLAINDTWTDRNGQKQERVCFVDIVTWARLAEICGQYLAKGRQALVEGRLNLRTWETEQGEKRSKMEVVAQTVQFLGARGEGGERPQGDRGGPDGSQRAAPQGDARSYGPPRTGATGGAPSTRAPAPQGRNANDEGPPPNIDDYGINANEEDYPF